MSLKPSRSAWGAPHLRRTLAFRLSAAYSLAGLILVILATASLYIVLRTELDRSTELFLADKLHEVGAVFTAQVYTDDGNLAARRGQAGGLDVQVSFARRHFENLSGYII